MTIETTVLVTDDGFAPAPPAARAVATLGPADDPATLADRLDTLDLIRVEFPKFSDGRGFTHARALRRMGYAGRLHAVGHVIADQYAMARRSGFDAVEIDADLARRQPEDQWRARADWRAHDYQSRLRG
ncbi:DUF934 domain-containing protein [Palleronia sp. KMU-117]|uniref:DUF934 domain-containing protein n=1 Tax=Palleronia sp. KMU-117 TaxID=3434108 RepID=UPI003D71687C